MEAEAQPEVLAHHSKEAGLGEQAVPNWQRAGQRAIERLANLEAIAHLTRALELIFTHVDANMAHGTVAVPCIREIQELIDVVPLRRPVVVVDGTTDQSFLRQTLESSWSRMRTASPNRAATAEDLQLLRLDALGGSELRRLLQQLCDAVVEAPAPG